MCHSVCARRHRFYVFDRVEWAVYENGKNTSASFWISSSAKLSDKLIYICNLDEGCLRTRPNNGWVFGNGLFKINEMKVYSISCVAKQTIRWKPNCQFPWRLKTVIWWARHTGTPLWGIEIPVHRLSSLANHIRSRIIFVCRCVVCTQCSWQRVCIHYYYFNFIKAPSDGRGKVLLVAETLYISFVLFFFPVASLCLTIFVQFCVGFIALI